MGDRVRNLKVDICADFSSLEEMKKEYEKSLIALTFIMMV